MTDTIHLKTILFEDFASFKCPTMTLSFPHCDFKCEKDAGGINMCQNSELAHAHTHELKIDTIYEKYASNDITKAIMCAGLEPLFNDHDFEELCSLIEYFRKNGCVDPFIVYTGYNEDEVAEYVNKLREYGNVIVKFGRYVPNQNKHYDYVLGIELASNNQYAKYL